MIGRRIVGLLNEYRQAELQAGGARPERLRECQEMFEFVDVALAGINYAGPESRLAGP